MISSVVWFVDFMPMETVTKSKGGCSRFQLGTVNNSNNIWYVLKINIYIYNILKKN